MRRWVVGVALMSWVVAVPPAAHGATTRLATAAVPEARIVMSYPAGWVNIPLAESKFETALDIARAQDPGVTREQLRAWLELRAQYDASFFVVDRRSRDNALVRVRNDDFDKAFDVASVAQLRRELRAELKQQGLRLGWRK